MPTLPIQEKHITLAIGGKLPVEAVIESSGGGACNTSVGLSRLGCQASFCGVVGSDQWGEKLLHTLVAERVNTSPATIIEEETSSFSIILTLKDGERTILYAPGANEHLHDVTFDLEATANADAVYLNHLNETSCVIEDDIIKTLLEKPGLKLTWNPGGCQIAAGMHRPDKAALLKRTNLLLLNKEEALDFTRMNDVMHALRALIDAGVANTCITDGKNGTIASDGKKIFRCPVLPVQVVETTGAGDAFGTGVMWGLLKGFPLPEALVAGTLNAAGVVGAVGAQTGLLTETQMQRKLSEHPLTVETL
jgi:ribokinase